jgi:nucleoside-diphosphate-sugar epimerase
MLISAIDKMLLNENVDLTECIQMWNFLYIKDAVDGVIKLMEVDCPDGVYNFGSNDTRKLRKFIEEIYNIIKTKSEIIYGAVPYPKTGMVSVQPIIEKLKKETGWEPITRFEDGVKEVITSREKKLGAR